MSTSDPITVSVSQRGICYDLSKVANEAALMEGSALVTIKAPTKAKVFLNDEVIDCSWQSKESIGFAHIDLTNQVGFRGVQHGSRT